jgi:hypothetical protein
MLELIDGFRLGDGRSAFAKVKDLLSASIVLGLV